MPFAEINGIHSYYELKGCPDLPVLTFSHSLGADLDMWRGQVEALGSHYQILCYDTRGHGQSGTSSKAATMADLGEDVLGLLDALDFDKTNFCGISMGGVIGQWLAIRAPQRLEKLVLANTAAKIGNADTWNARMATVLQNGLSPIVDGTIERWFTAAFREEQPVTVANVRSTLAKTDAAGYLACCAAIRDADFRDELGGITTPTLVIAGSADPVTTPSDGHFLASNIAAARYVELVAAHLSNLGAADLFNAALRGFLDT